MKFYFLLFMAFAPCTAQSSMIDSLFALEKSQTMNALRAHGMSHIPKLPVIKSQNYEILSKQQFVVTEYEYGQKTKSRIVGGLTYLLFLNENLQRGYSDDINAMLLWRVIHEFSFKGIFPPDDWLKTLAIEQANKNKIFVSEQHLLLWLHSEIPKWKILAMGGTPYPRLPTPEGELPKLINVHEFSVFQKENSVLVFLPKE